MKENLFLRWHSSFNENLLRSFPGSLCTSPSCLASYFPRMGHFPAYQEIEKAFMFLQLISRIVSRCIFSIKTYVALRRFLYQAQEIPGVKIFRCDSPLFYANVEYFRAALIEFTRVDPQHPNRAPVGAKRAKRPTPPSSGEATPTIVKDTDVTVRVADSPREVRAQWYAQWFPFTRASPRTRAHTPACPRAITRKRTGFGVGGRTWTYGLNSRAYECCVGFSRAHEPIFARSCPHLHILVRPHVNEYSRTCAHVEMLSRTHGDHAWRPPLHVTTPGVLHCT